MREKGMRRGKLSRRGIFAGLSILLVALMVLAACGEAATATPEPTAAPEPTAVPDEPDDAAPAPTEVPDEPDDAAPDPTATPVAMDDDDEEEDTGTGLRPRSEWTEENPATFEELEAEIEKYRGASFVFTSWGGAYQAAQRQAYIEPFVSKFGIEIVEESPMSYARIPAMVETGNYSWHVMDVGGRELWAQIGLGNLEELDMSVVDNRNHVETVRTRFGGGGGITWSTVLAYNTDAFPEGEITGWDAFFDRDSYPGPRSVRDAYRGSWFSALLDIDPSRLETQEGRAALGAPTDEDVQAALAHWSAFPPDNFWTTGSDCPQFLISGENVMCTAWNGRIFNAQQEGEPLGMCWECGHLVGTGALVLADGFREANPEAFEIAQLWIAWTGHPHINAAQSKYISYGPLNLKSAEFLTGPEFEHVLPELPVSPANVPYAIFENEKYSGEKNSEWNDLWLGYLQSVGS